MLSNMTTMTATDALQSSRGLDYLMVDYWNEYGDPRTGSLSMMGSFKPLLIILAVYAIFVQFIGPRMMKNRKPFSLKSILLAYNLLMSVWNAYFFYRVALVDYNFGLDSLNMKFPTFDDTSPAIMSKINIGHLYFFSKLVDLCDTVFFVLRKKQNQVTWLHFYHHISVPFFGWIHFRLCGTNSVVVPFGLMNSFIHTLMYGYYGLAALGPHMQPYLWWKRYITQIQIAQFVVLFAYGVYFSLFQEGYHVFFTYNILIQSLMYMSLFTRFYLKTYQKKPAAETAAVEAKKEL